MYLFAFVDICDNFLLITFTTRSTISNIHPVHSPPGFPHYARITSSQSQPSLSPSVTPSAFYCRLKLICFTNPFLPGAFWTASTDLKPVQD